MRKLISRGVNAESNPFSIDMTTEMNMNKALMSNALPMFVDIAFTFISSVWILFCKYRKNLCETFANLIFIPIFAVDINLNYSN